MGESLKDDVQIEEERLEALLRYDALDTPTERSFDHITDLICMILNVPLASVTLVDKDRVCFKSLMGSGIRELSRDLAFSAYVVDSREPMIVPDARLDPRTVAHPMVVGDPYLRCYIGVPLVTPDGHCIGTLCALDYVPREFTLRHVALLEKFAAVVMDQIELREHAERDQLTGALSRRAFLRDVEREVIRFQRYHRSSALMLIDVDNFKQVNDLYSHLVGDQVLREVGDCCEAVKRLGDSFGRLGGDEFAILLPETEEEEAMALAERLREVLGRIRVDAAPDLRISASFGITEISSLCPDRFRWVEAADRGLYDAKNSGRNRCCVGLPVQAQAS